MKNKINWRQLAEDVGSFENGQEHGSNTLAQKAIENLIGEEAIRDAVDYYINGGPGSELARFVIWQIHPISAMQYCYEIYKSERDIEEKRSAVELLRVAADHRVVPWIKDFLSDPDKSIQLWGFGILDQLLWSELVDEEEVSWLLELAERSTNEHLLERVDFVKGFLKQRNEHE